MAPFILGLPCALVLSLLLLDPHPVAALWWLAAGGLAFWIALTRYRRAPVWLRPIAALVVASVLGWQLAGLANERFAPWALEAGRVYQLSGTVEGLPDSNYFRHRIRLQPDCVASAIEREQLPSCDVWNGSNLLWPVYLEVSIPRKQLARPPMPGQRWHFAARFQSMEPYRNPGSFNAPRWYRSTHVTARFAVGPGDTFVLQDDSSDWLERARFTLRETLLQQAASRNTSVAGIAVPLALVTGDRSLMQDEHWQVFNATGTTHLVAISGSHIVLVAGVVMWLLGFPLRRWLWLTHRIPASHVAATGGFLVAWLYGAIAGFGLPVQRALIMLGVFVLLKLAGRVQQLWFALALAFFLVLVWDPMAVYALGFWLSFLAVFWILWMSGGAVFKLGWLRGWLRVQVGIFFGLAPVLLWQIQNMSLVSCATNAFAIPLVGAVLTPLSLLWALAWSLIGDSANGLLQLASWLTDLLMLALGWFADWRYALLHVPVRSAQAMLLGLAGVLWLCTAGLPGRWLAPLLLVPLLLPSSRGGEVWVHDSGGPIHMAASDGERILFIGPSSWPRLIPSWQQGFLSWWGAGLPSAPLPVTGGTELWLASSWTFTELPLRRNLLGEPQVQQLRFGDLCQPQPDARVPAQVVFHDRNRCVARLQWADQSWLLWPTLSQKIQLDLLLHHKEALAVQRILLNPGPQERLAPALLQFWQQLGAELILTRPPNPELLQQIESSALAFRVISEMGAILFPQNAVPSP